MDTLLNAPILLVLLVALIGVVLIVSSLRTGRSGLRRAGYVFLVAALVLELAALFVPTDQKKVEQKSRDLLTAIGHKDWNAAGPMLKSATLYGWSGDDLTRLAHDNVEHYGLTDLRINSMSVHKDPLSITVRASVTTHHTGQWVDRVPSTWDLQYQKRGPTKDWTLLQIIPITIGNMNNGADKEAILRGYVR